MQETKRCDYAGCDNAVYPNFDSKFCKEHSFDPPESEDDMAQPTKPSQPSAGEIKAGQAIARYVHNHSGREAIDANYYTQIIHAHLIHRETGMAELLKAAKALCIAAVDTGLTREQEDDNQDVQLVDAVLAVEQAIVKYERGSTIP